MSFRLSRVIAVALLLALLSLSLLSTAVSTSYAAAAAAAASDAHATSSVSDDSPDAASYASPLTELLDVWARVSLPQPPRTALQMREEAAAALLARDEAGGANPALAFARIVNGAAVTNNANLKFMAVLRSASTGNWFCGGALVSPNYVATANHCVRSSSGLRDVSSFVVTIGCLTLSSTACADSGSGATSVTVSVTHILENPNYASSTFNNDVTLLRIGTAVTTITPLPIASPSNRTMYCPCMPSYVAGWGTLVSGGSTAPSTLRIADVPVVSDSRCTSQYGSSSISTNTMFCAGNAATCTDSCQGDSGGPIFINATDGTTWKYYMIGVVSWGIGCGFRDYPGVYTRIDRFYTAVTNAINSGSTSNLASTTDSNAVPTTSECTAQTVVPGVTSSTCASYPSTSSQCPAGVALPSSLVTMATVLAGVVLAVAHHAFAH